MSKLMQHQLQVQNDNVDNNKIIHSQSHSSPVRQDGCRLFSIGEIQSATNNFDDALVVGKGGFGKVYKGLIDTDSISKTTVAVKRLDSNSNQGAHEFWAEIELLTKYKHLHLVSLVGYCNDDNEMIIVYEYLPHGSISDHLYKSSRNGGGVSRVLTWEQRLKICIGAARGLEYLHTGGGGVNDRVKHCDIKSSNILLDENWEAKISDFGLSKIGPGSQARFVLRTKVRGTFGYLDPEILLTHRLTTKSDIHAFGVVLFVVLCGRPALDFSVDRDQKVLARYAPRCIKRGTLDQIIDPLIRGQISPDCLKVFAEIAGKCLNHYPQKRPTMTDVVAKLELALVSQESNKSLMICRGVLVDTNGENKSLGNSNFLNESESEIICEEKSTLKQISASGAQLKEEHNMMPKIISAQSIIHFSFKDLELATNNFSIKLGRSTYKGVLPDGSQVAVKKLDHIIKHGHKVFPATTSTMSNSYHHLNLLRLEGVCLQGTTSQLLVYEYMPNGSLDRWIFNKSKEDSLDWDTRYKIAVGVARGLVYLHEDGKVKIIHGDINPKRVILDKDFLPKLFINHSLSIPMSRDQSNVTTTIRGTMGYIAPEWITGTHISEKIDVYSFGIMMLEMIGGRRNVEKSENGENVYFTSYAFKMMEEGKFRHILDTKANAADENDDVFERVSIAIKVAFWCIQDDPTLRPSMTKVVQMLECLAPTLPPPKPSSRNYSNLYESISDDDYTF